MSLKIIKAGLLDTVQDIGRYGYQHQGINPGGAMDWFAASLANALLGKAFASPVIEMHFPASQFQFAQQAVICITGADFTPFINDAAVAMNQPLFVNKEAVLSFRGRRNGSRCYVSFLQDLELEPWLNSFSTNLKAAAGGYKGKALQKGDKIDFPGISIAVKEDVVSLPWRYAATEKQRNEIGFICGPEWNWLTTKSQTQFLNNRFTITPASDRMGYRLQGEPLEPLEKKQLISSSVNFGTVQLLPSGQLIVLMADHQTTGGYPRIASVIRAHLPWLAQISAGDELQFVMTTIEEAEEKFMEQQKTLLGLQNTCKLKLQNWLDARRHKL